MSKNKGRFINDIEDARYVSRRLLDEADASLIGKTSEKRLKKIRDKTSKASNKYNVRRCIEIFDEYCSEVEDDLCDRIKEANRKDRQSRGGENNKDEQSKTIRVSSDTYTKLETLKNKRSYGSFDETVDELLKIRRKKLKKKVKG